MCLEVVYHKNSCKINVDIMSVIKKFGITMGLIYT